MNRLRAQETSAGEAPIPAARCGLLIPSGNEGFVYWVPTGMSEVLRPGSLTCDVELLWQEPVLVDLVEDAVYPLDAAQDEGRTQFDGLPLTDYPLIVADRRDIPVIEA